MKLVPALLLLTLALSPAMAAEPGSVPAPDSQVASATPSVSLAVADSGVRRQTESAIPEPNWDDARWSRMTARGYEMTGTSESGDASTAN
jgi:hypothetical protein